MLKGKDIVFMNLSRWDSPIVMSGLMLAREMARHNRVLYIDHPMNYLDILKQRKSSSVKNRIRSFMPGASGLHSIENNGFAFHGLYLPPILPINPLPDGKLYDVFSWFNHKIIGCRIRRAIKKLKMKDVVFINGFNFYFPDAYKLVKPSLNIYYCVDELIKPYSLRHGRRNEDRMTREADVVVTTSDSLYENRSRFNSNCFVVHNAGDFRFFTQSIDPAYQLLAKGQSIPRPIIGFYGNIERRTDYEILQQVFGSHPEWSLVMVGPIEKQYVPDSFLQLKNLYLPGKKSYQEIPSVLNQFDVALIPYKTDKVSLTIFPMKLYEYLSSGKPVVSLNFNPQLLASLSDVVYVAEDASSLADRIAAALTEHDGTRKARRIELANQNTWEARAESFSVIVEQELAKKPQKSN